MAENRTKRVGNKIVNKRRFNTIIYSIYLLWDTAFPGMCGGFWDGCPDLVFSDEAVCGVSGEVNKRNTWILDVENSDVQPYKCVRSDELRTRFRREISSHRGLCTGTCWKTPALHNWTKTRGPIYCSNKFARPRFCFDMPATSFTAITLGNLSAVATLFLGLEGHRT
jgi:hypothetical protein